MNKTLVRLAVNIYLDDIRPTPEGWSRAYTARGCIELMQTIGLENLGVVSLDHDLGICDACHAANPDEAKSQIVLTANTPGYLSCPHNGTGYDVVLWMEEHDFWPEQKPRVHSANPSGRDRMLAAINRAYRNGMRLSPLS